MAKTFKGNTASELFINKPAQPQPVKEEKQTEGLVIPEGYVLKPAKRAIRMQILVSEYTRGLLTAEAERTGLSFNEIINKSIEEHFNKKA